MTGRASTNRLAVALACALSAAAAAVAAAAASAATTAAAVATAPAVATTDAEPRRWTPEAITSAAYESSPAFSPDGRELYFMRADASFSRYQVLVSRCEGGRWTVPVPPSFALLPPVNDADPFITRDGRRLYFVSSRPDPQRRAGSDDLDIWRSDRGADGRWGPPQRLPEPVNSIASELLPREDAQGRLVFGSSRAGGQGQGDIWRAMPLPDGTWRVENLGPPVSSPANEYESEQSRDGRSLVLVVDRGRRSHLERFTLGGDGRWTAAGRLPGRDDVFQVGPLLSPRGERLLFAQADGDRSGELFLVDLVPDATEDWPPRCGR
jgi:Tol biopolymer transport system component